MTCRTQYIYVCDICNQEYQDVMNMFSVKIPVYDIGCKKIVLGYMDICKECAQDMLQLNRVNVGDMDYPIWKYERIE